MKNENALTVGLDEFPEFFTQMVLGGMSDGHEATPNAEDSLLFAEKSPNGPLIKIWF